MNGIPRFEGDGCTPYLQIFSHSKLIFTSTGLDSKKLRCGPRDRIALACCADRAACPCPSEYKPEDISVLFPVDLNLEGDVLIRVRHISKSLQRQSMLRFVSARVGSTRRP
jgi:hypothetical protein